MEHLVDASNVAVVPWLVVAMVGVRALRGLVHLRRRTVRPEKGELVDVHDLPTVHPYRDPDEIVVQTRLGAHECRVFARLQARRPRTP